MPFYEVFIPAKPGTNNESVTVEVEASSWLLALRSGMHQIGEQGESLSSIMCENRPDGTVVVKDPTSRRMFRIMEVKQGEAAGDDSAELAKQEAEQKRLREEAEKAAKEREEARRRYEESIARQKEAEEQARKEREEARQRALEAEKQAKLEAERKAQEEAEKQAKLEAERIARKEAETQAKLEAELKAKAEAEKVRLENERKAKEEADKQRKHQEELAKAAIEAARQREAAEKELKATEARAVTASRLAMESAEGTSRNLKVTHTHIEQDQIRKEIGDDEVVTETFDLDEVLADLFIDMMDVTTMAETDAAKYTLDLALKIIKAEAGSVIMSDYNSALQDLFFAAARGEVANKLSDIRIPRGKGIVGFSVQMGCPLAVSDVSQNPNFYRAVSDKTGYKTRSILCVPVQYGQRTFGAIELVNKVGSDRWTPGELNVVHFLAQKLGEHLFSIADKVALDLR